MTVQEPAVWEEELSTHIPKVFWPRQSLTGGIRMAWQKAVETQRCSPWPPQPGSEIWCGLEVRFQDQQVGLRLLQKAVACGCDGKEGQVGTDEESWSCLGEAPSTSKPGLGLLGIPVCWLMFPGWFLCTSFIFRQESFYLIDFHSWACLLIWNLFFLISLCALLSTAECFRFMLIEEPGEDEDNLSVGPGRGSQRQWPDRVPGVPLHLLGHLESSRTLEVSERKKRRGAEGRGRGWGKTWTIRDGDGRWGQNPRPGCHLPLSLLWHLTS